ncbi:MAG TPA: hypothetical protein VIK53_14485 [Verrucomicrobiae bacterium]
MQKKCLLLSLAVSLAGAVLFCGCDKQEKINSRKIDALSQKIVQLEQLQTNQVVALQSQMKSLVPTLDQLNGSYFEKNRDSAMFFHTNTLFLLLTIGKQIETQLQAAEAERQVQNSQAYAYHTNQLGALYLGTVQIEDALTSQERRIEDSISAVNAETGRANAALSNALINTSNALMNAFNDELSKQIKSLAPDAAEIARRKKLEADVVQIQHQLDLIKARLEATNQPAARP